MCTRSNFSTVFPVLLVYVSFLSALLMPSAKIGKTDEVFVDKFLFHLHLSCDFKRVDLCS